MTNSNCNPSHNELVQKRQRKTRGWGIAAVLCAAALLVYAGEVRAQESAAPSAGAGEALTMKRAVELALSNSRELAAARLQQDLVEKSAGVAKAEF